MANKTEYQNVNVSIKNIEELKKIKRKLESFHNEDFRIDIAIGHILRVYRSIMKAMKNKNLERYEKYLQIL